MADNYRATITIHLEADDQAKAPNLLKQALFAMTSGSSKIQGKLLNNEGEYQVTVVENQKSSQTSPWQEALEEALKFYEQEPTPEEPAQENRTPTEDEKAGMNWWNSLTHEQAVYWLGKAPGVTPSSADAWKAYKQSQGM